MNIELFGKNINARYVMHTRRFATYAVLLAVFSLSVVGLFIVPQAQNILDRFGELRTQETQVQQLQRKLAQLQELPQSELFLQADKINQILPSRKPLLELLTAFSDVSRATSVTYSDLSLSPGRVATAGADLVEQASRAQEQTTQRRTQPQANTRRGPASGVESLNVRLKITGQLENINAFLTNIEAIAPITTVTRLSLAERSSQRDSVGSLFEAELEVETYFFTRSISTSLAAPIPVLNATQQVTLEELNTYVYPDTRVMDVIRGGSQDPFRVSQPELFGL